MINGVNMRVIAIANFKGGVGKSSVCMNLGAALHQKGKKVLLIDLDPGAALTYYALGQESETVKCSSLDVLLEKVQPEAAAIEIKPGFSLVPADFELMTIETARKGERSELLKEALAGVRGFDYVLIDTPPAINIFTVMAIVASSRVYIVVNADMFSYRAMMTLEDVIKGLSRKVEMRIIVNLFDSRRNIEKEIFRDLKTKYSGKVFNSTIRRNVAIPEGVLLGLDVFSYRKSSPVAADFATLAKEVIKKEEKN